MKQVTEKDRLQLIEITKSMQEEKFEFIDKIPGNKMKQMTNMFKDMTNEDLEAVLNKKMKKDKKEKGKDKRQEVFLQFKEGKELIKKLI